MGQISSTESTMSDEAGSLALELVSAYRQMIALYRDDMGYTEVEAHARARGLDMSSEQAARDVSRIRGQAPAHVTWSDLQRLADCNPDQMVAVWDEMKGDARDELASGHRAAQALDWQRRPWTRARYLAIRDSLRADSPPQTGVEAALLDMAAEAMGDYLEWSEQLHIQASSEVASERDQLREEGRWSAPRQRTADAIEQSSRMAERAHKRFLQTIKAFHELRRSSSSLYVRHAGQINVGQQQVNVTQTTPSGLAPSPDLSK
jgi:hypothetical protein